MSRTGRRGRKGLPSAAAAGIPVPADRRFRRSEVRPGRRRNWRAWLGRFARWTVAAGAVLLLGLWAGGALLDASALRVANVMVQGNARVPAAELADSLDGLRGENILLADLEHFRLRLLGSPWIERAELWRVLPSTVHVKLVERTPLAVARHRGQLFLVDRHGVLIDRFGPAYQDLDLPIVDGLIQDGRKGMEIRLEGLGLVERLFAEFAARPDLFGRISQVDVSDPRNAVLLLDGEAAELRLGDRDFLARMRVYEETAPALRAQREVNEYFDLRYGDRYWVK
jgi:cell division septal protein FtsQ